MSWRDVRILYLRELRAALRERSIVVNSLLVPLLLYPLILWATFSAVAFVQGLSERFDSRVALVGLPAAHAAIADSLKALDHMRIEDAPATVSEARRLVEEDRLDVLVEFLPPDGTVVAPGAALPDRTGGFPPSGRLEDNFRIRITYDNASDRSRSARARVAGFLERYRAAWIERETRRLDIAPRALHPFDIAQSDVASSTARGASTLSRIVPLFLVIMVALGCFMPAIDTTAGERERSTWETLMTVAASRGSVITAKYLYVATLGVAAGFLNVGAVALSLGPALRPLLGDASDAFSFRIPLVAFPVMLIGTAGLALFFAAAMMILASFARTFREGQSMITPIYWLALLPMILGSTPDQTLTPRLALVPIANVAMMIGDAIRGVFHWPLIGLTLAVELLLVLLCLWLARRILGFEDLLLGSYGGSFWRFLRERVRGGNGRVRA